MGVFNLEKINEFFNYIFTFLILNILFWLFDFPIIAFAAAFGIGWEVMEQYYPIMIVCLIPMGPALCALFHCMNRLIRDKEIRWIKDFWIGYKQSFIASFLTAIVQAILVFMLITNIRFFAVAMPALVYIFIILLLLVILSMPVAYLLIMKFNMSAYQLLKATITITFAKPACTIGNAAAFLVLLIVFGISPGTTILFVSSVYAFLVVFMNHRMLLELAGEDKKEQDTKEEPKETHIYMEQNSRNKEK